MGNIHAYVTLNQITFHAVTRSYYRISRSGTNEDLSFWPAFIARNYDMFAS